MTGFPAHAVARTVKWRFAGHDLRSHLSHALFSSHHIDDGTLLLLKTLVQQDRLPAAGRALDAGCGVGPLAIALKKHRPGLTVVARDRLALACAFTAENARLNGVELDVAPALLLEGESGPYDLIVSNLPAKAGEPVLADFVARSLSILGPTGLVAVVVVAPLAAWLAQILAERGAEVVYTEATAAYTVFHYRGVAAATAGPFPEVYRRGRVKFDWGKKAFEQTTFYGLPNFDALDYRWRVTADALASTSWKKASLLVWEPDQGHVATVLRSQLAPGGVLHVAGNDWLALRATAANVEGDLHCVPTPAGLPLEGLGGAVFQVHSEPEVPWVDEAKQALLRLLAPGAPVLVNGTSTDLARFLDGHQGLRKARDEKYRGWRSVLFFRA